LKKKLIILSTLLLLFLSIKEINFFKIINSQNSFNITKENYILATSDNIIDETIKGRELFTQKLQKYCEMSGGKFALNYSQDEWEEILEAGQFNYVTLKICPKLKNIYQAKWTPTLYQFAYMFASDSGNVPSS
jgi:hypothetical protein